MLRSALVAYLLFCCNVSFAQQEIGPGAPLFEAVMMGDYLEVERLVEAGANPASLTDGSRSPILLMAARHGLQPTGAGGSDQDYQFTVMALVNGGAPVDQRGPTGWTALMESASKGFEKTANTLLSLGADPNAITDSGNSAIFFAAESGHWEVVEELVRRGARATQATQRSFDRALTHAVLYERLSTAGALLSAGADPQTKEPTGLGLGSLAHTSMALESGEEMLGLLVKYGGGFFQDELQKIRKGCAQESTPPEECDRLIESLSPRK